MATLKVPTKLVTDNFLLQDYKDDFNAINNEVVGNSNKIGILTTHTSGYINIKDAPYQAKGDGITDDTIPIQNAINDIYTNKGGKIFFPRGVYIIGGALQDTSGANAQIILPNIPANIADSMQITIEFVGEISPPPIVYVVAPGTPLPTGHTILKSTLPNGSAGNLIGCYSATGLAHFSNLYFSCEKITLRLPPNPSLTALDLSHVCCADIDNFIVDASSYVVSTLQEPTFVNSYGIKTPLRWNGAHTRLGSTDVIGFYNGYLFGEHSNGQQVGTWACKNSFIFETADHSSIFQRLNAHHCTNNVIFTGQHLVEVNELNIEHDASTTDWKTTINDISDINNVGQGTIRYSSVDPSFGQNSLITILGGNNISAVQIMNKGNKWNAGVFTNNWVNHPSFGYSLQYKKDGTGQVTIRGTVKSGTLGTSIFTLPLQFRPARIISFPNVSGRNFGTVDIYPNGEVYSSQELGNAGIGLEGLSFYTS